MNAYLEMLDGRVAGLLQPIGGPSAVGRDVSYDPLFEQLAGEIEKLATVGRGAPNWQLIEESSERVLREHAKDLRALTWLAAARAQRQGWEGLAEALHAYRALADRYWETMFPTAKRPRGRANLGAWLWETLAGLVPTMAVTAADADAVEACRTLTGALDALFAQHLGDAAPNFARVRSALDERRRALPAPAPAANAAPLEPEPSASARDARTAPTGPAEPAPAPAVEALAAPTAAPVPAVAPVPLPEAVLAPGPELSAGTLSEAESAADRLAESLLVLARHARRVAPSHPWAFRLARLGAWITLDEPPKDDDGKALARGPRPAERTALERLEKAAQWEALVDACEEALFHQILWLDIHRFEATALEHLGVEYRPARDAVGREVAFLCRRLPMLATSRFATGTPFASPETVEWIARETARWTAASPAATSGTARERPQEQGGGGALLADARNRIASGSVDEGLAWALRAAEGAAGGRRERFEARLTVAELALEMGKSVVARALLADLFPDVNDTLEAWAPNVASRFLIAYVKAERADAPEGRGDGDDTTFARSGKESDLFRRLLRLDPEAALRLWA